MPGIDDLDLPPGARDDAPAGAGLALDPAIEARIEAAIRAGLFCSACAEPMEDDGWEYVSFRTEIRPSGAVVVSGRAFLCNRESCADARARLEKSAAARRPWPAWHIFAVEVPDTPPADESPPGAEGTEPPEQS